MTWVRIKQGLINTKYARSIDFRDIPYTEDETHYVIELALVMPEQGRILQYNTKEERDRDFNRMEKQIQSE